MIRRLTMEGFCEFGGCNIQGACNYDSEANTNDGTCDFLSCIGCLNDAACNYDPSAQYAGSCTFPEPGFNCTGDCASDVDEDGVCDGDEVPGCTNTEALNFDPLATDDDGSCEFSAGCMNLLLVTIRLLPMKMTDRVNLKVVQDVWRQQLVIMLQAQFIQQSVFGRHLGMIVVENV